MLRRLASYPVFVLAVSLTGGCNGGSDDTSGAGSSGGSTVGEAPTTGSASTGDSSTGSSSTGGAAESTSGTTGPSDPTTGEPTTTPDPTATTVVETTTTVGETSTDDGTTADTDCSSCSEIVMGADPATVCPESKEEYDAYFGCVCGECMSECMDLCTGGSDVPVECFSCANDVIAGVCSEPANACLADA